MLRQYCCKCQKPQVCCAPAPQVCCAPAPQMCCMPAQQGYSMPMQLGRGKGSACSFPCLIILILILLQFGSSKRASVCCDPCEDPCSENRHGGFGLDSGILFIIALYYLSCACPCS